MEKKRILAVDDMPATLSIIKTLLRAEYEVFTTNSVKTAMKMLETDDLKFDLVLLDVDMPNVSGLEMLRMLKGHPNFRDLPVIMLTGRADQDSVVKAATAGAMDYIVKPFTAEVLKRKLRTALK